MHVDRFIDCGIKSRFGTKDKGEQYARWVLFNLTAPATLTICFREFMEKNPLYGTYKGVIYRVTGGSNLGDIWLAKDWRRQDGYDLRVDVAMVSNWSDKPDNAGVLPSLDKE